MSISGNTNGMADFAEMASLKEKRASELMCTPAAPSRSIVQASMMTADTAGTTGTACTGRRAQIEAKAAAIDLASRLGVVKIIDNLSNVSPAAYYNSASPSRNGGLCGRDSVYEETLAKQKGDGRFIHDLVTQYNAGDLLNEAWVQPKAPKKRDALIALPEGLLAVPTIASTSAAMAKATSLPVGIVSLLLASREPESIRNGTIKKDGPRAYARAVTYWARCDVAVLKHGLLRKEKGAADPDDPTLRMIYPTLVAFALLWAQRLNDEVSPTLSCEAAAELLAVYLQNEACAYLAALEEAV